MSKEIAVPDYLKKMMDEGKVSDQTSGMMDGAGGVPRLTTKGKVWRFKVGEDEVKAGQSVDVIIVGMNPQFGLSHTYYREAYSDDSNAPPDCSSMNGLNPDPWINEPVNDKCQTCPMQKWGSAKSMSGGKAKACRDSKQLYVAKASEFSEDPSGCTLYLMQVTVNSLRAFANYGKELSSKGIPGPQFVVTRMSFDEDASVPKVEFEVLGALNEKLGIASMKRSEKREWDAGAIANAKALANQSGNNKNALPNPDSAQDAKQDEESKPDLSSEDVDSLIDNW